MIFANKEYNSITTFNYITLSRTEIWNIQLDDTVNTNLFARVVKFGEDWNRREKFTKFRFRQIPFLTNLVFAKFHYPCKLIFISCIVKLTVLNFSYRQGYIIESCDGIISNICADHDYVTALRKLGKKVLSTVGETGNRYCGLLWKETTLESNDDFLLFFWTDIY